jgi:hypothetical protein
MVAPLVIGLQQHIPFPKLHALTPQHSICVCITSHQEPALVVHRGCSVSVALTGRKQLIACLEVVFKGLVFFGFFAMFGTVKAFAKLQKLSHESGPFKQQNFLV